MSPRRRPVTPVRIPSEEDQVRCLALRIAAKRKQPLLLEDLTFLARMEKWYPLWYERQEAEVIRKAVQLT